MKPEFKPEFKLDPPSPKKSSPKEETLPVIYSVRMVRFPQVAISLDFLILIPSLNLNREHSRNDPEKETLPVSYRTKMVGFPQVAISLAVKTRNWGTLVKIEKLEQSNIAKKQIAKKFNYLTLGVFT